MWAKEILSYSYNFWGKWYIILIKIIFYHYSNYLLYFITTFSSEVHFGDELRIVSGDLSLQIECIGHQNETKVGM